MHGPFDSIKHISKLWSMEVHSHELNCLLRKDTRILVHDVLSSYIDDFNLKLDSSDWSSSSEPPVHQAGVVFAWK